MNYQGGTTAKYQMADRIRQAERAQIAQELARRKGLRPARRLPPAVLSLLALPFRH
jgi:hypothetical protein